MDEIRLLQKSFRMEMMGAGLYKSLAVQYKKKDPALKERFAKFSKDEYMHGKMFGKLFLKDHGQMLKGEKFWIFMGRVMAFFMRPLSLKKKMKKLSIIEARAVEQIERDLPSCQNPGLKRIMKTILPDEADHAGLYRQWFPA